jgi:hypothetical protein
MKLLEPDFYADGWRYSAGRQKGSPHSLNSPLGEIEDKLLGRLLIGMLKKKASA